MKGAGDRLRLCLLRPGLPGRDQSQAQRLTATCASPVQPKLGALHQPRACPGRQIAALAPGGAKRQCALSCRPAVAAYRDHDYWAYREIVARALRDFPAAGSAGGGRSRLGGIHPARAARHVRSPGRRIVHVVAYQPRRTLQSIPHVRPIRLDCRVELQAAGEGEKARAGFTWR